MDTTIRDDFEAFTNDCSLFNSDVKLYADATKSTLIYDGKAIYDKKPNLVENEEGMLGYSGHKAMVTFTLNQLGMTAYSDLKGKYVEITDNVGTISYLVVDSPFNSNVASIFCYLKEHQP